jgi:hypothetical protein
MPIESPTTTQTEPDRTEPRRYTAIAAPIGHKTFRIVPYGTSTRVECECGLDVIDRLALTDHHKAVDTAAALDWATDGAS